MSRRAAEDLIAQGRVTVDGRPARLGDRADPSGSVVEVDGARLPLAPHLITYLVNKPSGVISTTSDPHAPRKVVDLVPDYPRVWPVGRLDRVSEGLIMLSNDGELTNLVTHPRYGIAKTYRGVGGRCSPSGHRAAADSGSGSRGRPGPGAAGSAGGSHCPGGPVGTGDERRAKPGDKADDGSGRSSGSPAGAHLDRTSAGWKAASGTVAQTVHSGGSGPLPGGVSAIVSA